MYRDEKPQTLAEIVADIVSAYVSYNALPLSGVSSLISSVELAVSRLTIHSPAMTESLVPAVNPKRSVHPDFITCLEDGKRFKSLKRHLAAGHGMVPDEYRAKWNLPEDYPMVALNYSAERSVLAIKTGLGRKPGQKVKKKATTEIG